MGRMKERCSRSLIVMSGRAAGWNNAMDDCRARNARHAHIYGRPPMTTAIATSEAWQLRCYRSSIKARGVASDLRSSNLRLYGLYRISHITTIHRMMQGINGADIVNRSNYPHMQCRHTVVGWAPRGRYHSQDDMPHISWSSGSSCPLLPILSFRGGRGLSSTARHMSYGDDLRKPHRIKGPTPYLCTLRGRSPALNVHMHRLSVHMR
jgi:hypothetical protein